MTKEDIIAKWRKQRGAAASSSEVGQRPLYEHWVNSADMGQPSAEPANFAEESVVCCKHGLKCSEYYTQKLFDTNRISSLWPMFELLRRDGQSPSWIGPSSAEAAILRPKKSYPVYISNKDGHDLSTENQYDNIGPRSGMFSQELTKTATEASGETLLRKSTPRKTAEELFPKTASKLEMLCRLSLASLLRRCICRAVCKFKFAVHYPGFRNQCKNRKDNLLPQTDALKSLTQILQPLPEDTSKLDNLKHYAPLYILFVNNDLQRSRLPVEECIVHGKRRLYVDCGDKNAAQFKRLEYLVRYYADNFDYVDRQGRKTRFPDNPFGILDAVHLIAQH